MPVASELQNGNYFIYKGEIVRVNRKEVVVYGTHSHSKLKFFIQGLYEKGERTINFHQTDRVEIVEIVRKLGQVVSKTSDKVQVMDLVSFDTFNANVPSELLGTLNESDQVTFIEFNGEVKILEKRD